MSVLAGAIISTAIGGITSYLQSSAASKEAKSQAQQLKNNMARLEAEVRRGEVDLEASLKRIDDMINNTTGELKSIMENQVNRATKDVTENFQKSLAVATQGLKSELGSRRLLGSEVGEASRRKTTKEVTGQAEKNITSLREQAIDQIAQMTAGLKLKGAGLKEGKREGFQRFRLGALSEIMQLGNISSSLERQASSNPFLAALAGAAPGLGDITSQLLSPGIGRTENIEGIAPAPAGTIPTTTPAEDIVKGTF